MKTKIQIKTILGEVLFEYESEDNNIKKTVEEAVKQDAQLQDAQLQGTELQGAWLRGAWLEGAQLQGAWLQGAQLQGAQLQDAQLQDEQLKFIPIYNCLTVNDYVKKYKIKKKGNYIYAYKGVSYTYMSPKYGKVSYKVGSVVEEKYADFEPQNDCGRGINLSPTKELALIWGSKTVEVKVHIGDIACIPFEDTKFRVKKCKVIKEIAR